MLVFGVLYGLEDDNELGDDALFLIHICPWTRSCC